MAGMRQQRVEVNGIHLHIRCQGEGPWVVLCHGYPGHWSNWRSQMQVLADAGYTAVVPDMRGYGQSSRPDDVSAYNMNQQIGDMCGLLDAFGIQQAVFVGQDFGASLVWNLALRQPERVRAVVGISVPFDHDYYGRSCMGHLPDAQLQALNADSLLVASPLHPPSVGFAAIAEQQFLHAQYFQRPGVADHELGHNAGEFLRRIYWALSAEGSLGDWASFPSLGTAYLDVLPPAPSLPWPWMSENDMAVIVDDYLRAGADNAFSGALASYRVADENWHIGEAYAAQNITVPALFIAGEADPVVASLDDEMVARMRQRIPDLQPLVLVPDAGHFVQLEKPEPVNRAISAFLTLLAAAA